MSKKVVSKKETRKIKVTVDEIMCARASKEIKDGDVVFTGHGHPLLSSYLAKKGHAPNCVIITEGGIIDPDPYRPLEHPNDFGSTRGASMCTDITETFTSFVLAGNIDVGYLAGVEIDKYGNLNTSYIGGEHVAGSGGQNEVGGYAKRTVISIRHGAFKEKCEYITTPGYLDGYDSRYKAGLPPGTGPVIVVSQKGVFRFDQKTKEMYLESYHPGVTLEEVKQEIPWDLKISPKVFQTPLPTEEELKFMREWAPTISLGKTFFQAVMFNYLQTFMAEAQSRKQKNSGSPPIEEAQ